MLFTALRITGKWSSINNSTLEQSFHTIICSSVLQLGSAYKNFQKQFSKSPSKVFMRLLVQGYDLVVMKGEAREAFMVPSCKCDLPNRGILASLSKGETAINFWRQWREYCLLWNYQLGMCQRVWKSSMSFNLFQISLFLVQSFG